MTDATHMTNDMVTAALLEAYGQAGGNDPAVVLLVDDEMGILKALRRVLRRDGHEVVLANGGREGIEGESKRPVGHVKPPLQEEIQWPREEPQDCG